MDRSEARLSIPGVAQGWQVHEAQPDIRARVTRDLPALSPSVEAEIDTLWLAAQARTSGALFNGRVFSVDTITPHLLTGHLTEFRRIVAQMERPELHDVLAVRPMAVCGVLICGGGVVIGRRPARAVYQAAMWQLPPAGSVDAGALRLDGWLDLQLQLFTELREELGLSHASITEMRPLCLVEHPGSHVLDLGFLLQTPLRAGAVLAAHAGAGNAEYEDLHVVPLDALPTRLNRLGEGLAPPARVFLRQLGVVDDPA